MPTTKKNVLVTGGSGFIGLHLVQELLKKGFSVSVLDRTPKGLPKKVRAIQGDITNQKIVRDAMKGIDLVYHLAGILGTEELNTKSVQAVKINVIGTVHVLNSALEHKTKVLLVSKPNVWLNTYSITKETSEKFTMMYSKEFALKATIVKWFSVYGPGQKHYGIQKAVPTLIVNALMNKPLPIFDDGKQMADFIYVNDTIEATILSAEDPRMEGKIVEIGTGKGTRIIDLANMISKFCKSNSSIKHLPMRGGEDLHTEVVADTRLLKTLNFKPKVDITSGLLETIKYYKNLLAPAHPSSNSALL